MKAAPIICLSTLLLSSPAAQSQSLEELLAPKGSAAILSSGNADELWKKVVEAFRTNDMAKAKEEGARFLASNFNASAFQVLGVKVMVSLAGGAAIGTTFENREDQETFKRLEAERANITKRYAELQEIIRVNDATINRITLNRRRAVQQGSPNHLECIECDRKIATARQALDELQKTIDNNKAEMAALQTKANQSLKPMTLQLLDKLLAAGEIDAAIAISNTYIRVIGNDVDVAVKQQDITRLQVASQKAAQVIELLKKEVQPMLDKRLFWEARDHARAFLTKVEVMSPDKDLLQFVKARAILDPLGIDRIMMLAQRSHDLIRAQAELDTALAMREFKTFKLDYPDHPQLKELELHINSIKVKSADELMTKAEEDFGELKKRFDPEKMRTTLSRNSTSQQTTTGLLSSEQVAKKSADDILIEMGVAPADTRVAKVTLEGLSARLILLEKTDLPLDRKTRLAAIKTEIDALMRLIQQ